VGGGGGTSEDQGYSNVCCTREMNLLVYSPS